MTNTLIYERTLEGEEVKVIVVNGENVQLFEYEDDETAADAVARSTVSDSASAYRNNLTGSGYHTYRAANVVAQYPGDDSVIINLLESVLGKEIFAGAMPSDKDTEAEARRLAKEMEERGSNS